MSRVDEAEALLRHATNLQEAANKQREQPRLVRCEWCEKRGRHVHVVTGVFANHYYCKEECRTADWAEEWGG
jgi:hypothetical protein